MLGIGLAGWLAIVAVVVAVLALINLRFRLFRRRKLRSRDRASLLNQARVEVLESTAIDAERRLVLVRCDKIEHLIMVGGPADLVVENDVRKVRAPAKPAAPEPAPRPAAQRQGAGAPPARQAPAAEAASHAAPRPGPPIQPPAQPAEASGQAPAQNRSSLTAVPSPPTRPAGRNGPTPAQASPARVAEQSQPRAAGRRSEPADSQFGRREAPAVTPQRRAPQALPTPTPANEPGERPRATTAPGQARATGPAGQRDTGRPVALPPAEVPWPEADSIENDIVEAFRVDARAQARDAPAARGAPPARDVRDSSTTLGDLADRLEEALAQEVQSANQDRRRLDLDLDAFGFERDRGEPEAAAPAPPPPEPRKEVERKPPEVRKPPEQRERPALKERVEAARAAAAPAPEPEARKEPPSQPERREEAPVISLNARRREALDPLEDEMARLLGELTGDTKGR